MLSKLQENNESKNTLGPSGLKSYSKTALLTTTISIARYQVRFYDVHSAFKGSGHYW